VVHESSATLFARLPLVWGHGGLGRTIVPLMLRTGSAGSPSGEPDEVEHDGGNDDTDQELHPVGLEYGILGLACEFTGSRLVML
jgi:hypothetical protein